MTPKLVLAILVCALVLVACRKKEEDEYPKSVRFEAGCDTCRVQYYIGGAEQFADVVVQWSHSFTVHSSKYMSVKLSNGLDSAETGWVKIYVDDDLFGSASTDQPAITGGVQTWGYP